MTFLAFILVCGIIGGALGWLLERTRRDSIN